MKVKNELKDANEQLCQSAFLWFRVKLATSSMWVLTVSEMHASYDMANLS